MGSIFVGIVGAGSHQVYVRVGGGGSGEALACLLAEEITVNHLNMTKSSIDGKKYLDYYGSIQALGLHLGGVGVAWEPGGNGLYIVCTWGSTCTVPTQHWLAHAAAIMT